MSQQPAQKPNFLNILLVAAMAFMGWQLFMGGQNRDQDERSTDQILSDLRVNNEKLQDVTAMKNLDVYLRKLGSKAESDGLSKDERDALELEAFVLAADTKLKSGEYRASLGDSQKQYAFNKLNTGYQRLKTKYEAFRKTDLWNEVEFDVAPQPELGFTATRITAAERYEEMVDKLADRSKDEKILGLISGYWVMDTLVNMTGAVPAFSYWFAAFLLAIIVRALVWPIAMKQYLHGRQMSRLQPFIKELKEKHTDKKTKQIKDPAAYQADTMALYKEYGLNPFAGCGPALIQIPFFLLIYQCMLLYRFEFTKGVFLWINPGSDSLFGIPIAQNLGERDYLLIVIYGISMVTSTMLQPVSDPSNIKQQRLMGIGISVFFSIMMFFWPLPSAFVVYWIFLNIFSLVQSYVAYRMPLPPLEKVATTAGGKRPTSKFMQIMEEAQRQAEKAREEQAAQKDENATNGKAEPGEGDPQATKDFFSSRGGGGGSKKKKKKKR